jgi:5-formyltetrahydrofolate cyclo-ligase
LRTQAQAGRRALSQAAPDAAERAAANVPDAVLAGVRSASVYRPMRHEMDCAPLIRRLAAHGVRILLPVVIGPARPLAFREADGGPLVPDAAGLPAPGPDAAAGRPDLLFVPLLAWDRDGRRLGYGGGYYDRTLAALRAEATTPVLAIGLAFAGQRLDALPHEPHDQKLDAILTEIGYSRLPVRNR